MRNIPLSKDFDDPPNRFTDVDLHILAGCFAGFCFNPGPDVPSLVAGGGLRSHERPLRSDSVAYEGERVFRGAGDNKHELDEVRAVWLAAKRRTSLTPTTDRGSYEDKQGISDSRFEGV